MFVHSYTSLLICINLCWYLWMPIDICWYEYVCLYLLLLLAFESSDVCLHLQGAYFRYVFFWGPAASVVFCVEVMLFTPSRGMLLICFFGGPAASVVFCVAKKCLHYKSRRKTQKHTPLKKTQLFNSKWEKGKCIRPYIHIYNIYIYIYV